jgi:rhodanese-related sulfurtransferase
MSKAVSPEEAQALIIEGHTYVDVRSEPEFEAGHPAGAINVPLSHLGAAGLEPNQDFMAVMARVFPKDAKLVIGCKSGGRSRRAAALLTSAGYTNIADMSAGFDGSRDAFGRQNPGWSQRHLPIETGAPSGRSYADIKKR